MSKINPVSEYRSIVLHSSNRVKSSTIFSLASANAIEDDGAAILPEETRQYLVNSFGRLHYFKEHIFATTCGETDGRRLAAACSK